MLSDYCADMQDIFLMRAGMTLQQDKTNITICIHHNLVPGLFTRRSPTRWRKDPGSGWSRDLLKSSRFSISVVVLI